MQHRLPQVFGVWLMHRQKRGLCGLMPHHAITSAHAAAATTDSLVIKGVWLVLYLFYSPGISTCYWFLFPHFKNQLQWTRFGVPRWFPGNSRGSSVPQMKPRRLWFGTSSIEWMTKRVAARRGGGGRGRGKGGGGWGGGELHLKLAWRGYLLSLIS